MGWSRNLVVRLSLGGRRNRLLIYSLLLTPCLHAVDKMNTQWRCQIVVLWTVTPKAWVLNRGFESHRGMDVYPGLSVLCFAVGWGFATGLPPAPPSKKYYRMSKIHNFISYSGLGQARRPNRLCKRWKWDGFSSLFIAGFCVAFFFDHFRKITIMELQKQHDLYTSPLRERATPQPTTFKLNKKKEKDFIECSTCTADPQHTDISEYRKQNPCSTFPVLILISSN